MSDHESSQPCGCDPGAGWVCAEHRCQQCDQRRAIVDVRAPTGVVQLCATCHAQRLAASSGT